MSIYSESEEKVLLHFFTNIDKDVYCATDNMPTSLWAFLLGGYSRSDLSMRDRFLKIFSEIAAENQTKYDQSYEEIISGIASSISVGSDYLPVMLEKSENFMRKWAVEYSHSSLKDSAYDRIAIENVSIRATKILEDSQQAAFQEKSTRYMDFSKDNFYIPESPFIYDEHHNLLTRSMELYRIVLDRAIEHFKTKISRDDFKSEAAWIRTCKAKAFDEARYLLPTSTKTSLGVTMATRETERWLSKLLAAPEQEIRDLAIQIQEECIKINPGLLKHVVPNDYLNQNNSEIANMIYNLTKNITPEKKENIGIELQVLTEGIEAEVLALGLFSMGTVSREKMKIIDADKIIDALDESEFFANRGPHDEFPKWASCGEMIYTFGIDIGAYRDIQRHRVGLQTVSDWNVDFGYTIPDILNEEGMSDLRDLYIEHCENIKKVVGDLYKNDRFNAAYFLILGYNVFVTYTMNFRQAAYFIELRSGPSGHYSYRRLAQDMFKLLEKEMPRLSKFIRVDMSGSTDRRAAEELIQQKIEKIQLERSSGTFAT